MFDQIIMQPDGKKVFVLPDCPVCGRAEYGSDTGSIRDAQIYNAVTICIPRKFIAEMIRRMKSVRTITGRMCPVQPSKAIAMEALQYRSEKEFV